MAMLSSRKEKFKWLLTVALVASALFALGEWLQATGTMKMREPASVPRKKPNNSYLGSGKVTSGVNVDLYALNPGPALAGQAVELQGDIRAKNDLVDVRFEWILPDGSSVSAPVGALSGSLGNMREGETTNVRLTVVKNADTNQQIHLRVYRLTESGEKLGPIAQYNTVLQQKIEKKAQEKAAIVRELRAYGSDFKIMR